MKDKLFKNKYVKNFYNILMTPAIRVLPGTLAYFLVMSIIPMLTFLVVICSKLSISTDFDTVIGTILPNGVEELMLKCPYLPSQFIDSMPPLSKY